MEHFVRLIAFDNINLFKSIQYMLYETYIQINIPFTYIR